MCGKRLVCGVFGAELSWSSKDERGSLSLMERVRAVRDFGGILKLRRSFMYAKPFVGRGTSSESLEGLLSDVTSSFRPHLFGVSGVKSGGGLG